MRGELALMREKKISAREKALFFEQLTMILKSGMTLIEGIDLLKDSLDEPDLLKYVNQIEQELIAYKPLHEALAVTHLLPRHLLSLVEIGLMAGKLEEVLDSLSHYYEREYALRERLKQAIFQPILLMSLFLVVVGVIVIKVLPIFNQIFLGLGSRMSGFAIGLMNIGVFMMSNLIWFIGIFFIIVSVLYVLIGNGKIKAIDSIPKSRSRFLSTMALMVASGISLEDAFKQSKGVINNNKFLSSIEESIVDLDNRQDFIGVLKKNHIINSWNIRLLEIADKTGSIDQAMEKVANAYEEEYEHWLDRRVSSIEPIFVILFSTLIGGILISVMFPLISIMSSIG